MVSERMSKKYAAVTNPWLIVLMLAMTALPIVAGFVLISDNLKHGGVLLGVGVFNLALFLLLLLPCVYTLTEEFLEIRTGVLRTAIPLETIKHADPSLRGVTIAYGEHSALLSPRARDAFLGDLLAAIAAKKSRESSTTV